MHHLSKLRLVTLRFVYGFIAFGLVVTAWPELLTAEQRATDPDSVVQAFLFTLSLLAMLGIVYPVKLLPILLFEFIWKLIWIAAFGLPAYMIGQIDPYGIDVFYACFLGLLITVASIPWKYVIQLYFKPNSDTLALQ